MLAPQIDINKQMTSCSDDDDAFNEQPFPHTATTAASDDSGLKHTHTRLQTS